MNIEATMTRTMDRIAAVCLVLAVVYLGASYQLANELGAAVSFGAFVAAFIGLVSALSIGHLAPPSR